MIDLAHTLILISAAGCAALVYAEYSGNDRLRSTSKFVASGAFVTLGIMLARAASDGSAQT